MHPQLARTLFGLQERILGRDTFAISRELAASQYWSRERMRQLQLQRLQHITAQAYEHTAYWRTLMDAESFSPRDICALHDLKRFPLLDKNKIRLNRETMVWRNPRRRQLKLVRTSGSTNEALQFYTDSQREAHINAARIRGHEWIGVKKGDREMYFWGSSIELSKQDRVKRLRDYLVNDGLTNGFELKPEYVADYFAYWMRWKPNCIFGYPNSLMLMVLMAKGQSLDLSALSRKGLKAICTTAEILVNADRQLIADAFGVPVYDSYGLREAGLIGHECAHGTMHTMDEQLLLETIDPHTGAATEGEGELVVTNLVSTVMPIIRYRTGDMVTLSSEACSCGLKLNRVRISEGRIADFVVTADGRWIPGYAFIYICRSLNGILKFQVQQERPGEVRVLLAVDGQFPSDGVSKVEHLVRSRLRSSDMVNVQVVPDIRPAPSGKYRPVISKVAEQRLKEAHLPAGSAC